MSNKKRESVYDIKKIDFSAYSLFTKEINKEKEHKVSNSNLNKKKSKFIFLNLGFRLGFVKKVLAILIAFGNSYSTTFRKYKRQLSRKIFFGRGVYFKVFSNVSVVFVLIFGMLMYSSTDILGNDEDDFISKFTGVESKEAILYATSGQNTQNTTRINPINYKIQDGDTLSTIANKFSGDGNKVSVDAIKWANNIKDSVEIKPGMDLIIPPIQGTLHTVEEDDTIEDIAIMHNKLSKDVIKKAEKGDEEAQIKFAGFTQELVDANILGIKVEGNKRVPEIFEGQTLIVPNGSVEVPDPTPDPTPTPAPYSPPVYASAPSQQVTIETVAPGSSGLIWPVAGGGGSISQYFYPWHTAVDIASNAGPALLAVANGTVITTGYEAGGCGQVVRIRHDNGYISTNCHTRGDLLQVGVGQRVTQGQVLTYMGCSGTCTGTHVHFMLQLTEGGGFVNPLGYIGR